MSVAVTPGAQLAGELEADDVGGEHVDGLTQHHGLGLDAADAPTEDADAVDHGGVAVGADEAVGVVGGLTVDDLVVRDAGDPLEVDLVDDAAAREARHGSCRGSSVPT